MARLGLDTVSVVPQTSRRNLCTTSASRPSKETLQPSSREDCPTPPRSALGDDRLTEAWRSAIETSLSPCECGCDFPFCRSSVPSPTWCACAAAFRHNAMVLVIQKMMLSVGLQPLLEPKASLDPECSKPMGTKRAEARIRVSTLSR
eukprot:m.437169 g.437169  ORF g.437169 m.437169 type:complete len:147 (+) comp56778_c1_seq23:2233-2673(+)